MSLAASWYQYRWESWIPHRLRERIQGYWYQPNGLQLWQNNTKSTGAPRLGERVTMSKTNGGKATGRYVHFQNHYGFIVAEDGVASEVWFNEDSGLAGEGRILRHGY